MALRQAEQLQLSNLNDIAVMLHELDKAVKEIDEVKQSLMAA